MMKSSLGQLAQEFKKLAKKIYAHKFLSQRMSETYWQKAKSTYLAPSEYYENKESALKNLLAKFSRLSSGLDIGCGDGRYTRLLAGICDEVVAYEMSPELILRSKSINGTENVNNIMVKSGQLPFVSEKTSFDLITCLGVTSCIISERYFKASIRNLAKLGHSTSTLVTIDTLSTGPKDLFNFNQDGYVAKYRNACRYQHAFEREGYVLTGAIKLLEDKQKGWINRLSIFEMNSKK